MTEYKKCLCASFWLNMLQWTPGCVCVCVSVCLSQPFIWTLFVRFWWNLDHLILSKIWDDTFSNFENVASMTSWRPFCMFMNAALSRSQFCLDFLQNYGQGSLVSFNVCYWKSAKSVNNFQSKKRTAFTKNRFLLFKPVSEVRGSIPGGDKSFATWFLLLLR